MSISQSSSSHFKNDQPRFTCTFTGVGNSTATDPQGVRFDAVPPSGTATTYVYGTDAELVKSSAGVYYVDLTLDTTGQWVVWFQATGSNAISDKHVATVVDRP